MLYQNQKRPSTKEEINIHKNEVQKKAIAVAKEKVKLMV